MLLGIEPWILEPAARYYPGSPCWQYGHNMTHILALGVAVPDHAVNILHKSEFDHSGKDIRKITQ
jgi:hypothetical protein